MSSGLVPLNQQNALPLYSPLAGAQGGQLTLIGGNLTRFWSSTDVGGLTSVGAPGAWITRGAQFNLESDAFDWRGCSRFSMVMTITNNTGVALGINAQWIVYLAHGTTGLVFPVADASKANLYQPSAVNIAPALANGTSIVRNSTWAAGQTITGLGALGAAGGYWKVIINTTVAANSISGVAFTTELWGAA